MIDGRTVMEVEPNGKSAEEIKGLWEYIDQRLFRLEAAPVDVAETMAATPFRNVNSLGREVPIFGRRAVS